MARPYPIQYAERLYGAIRAANFSPISFLAFGNAIKDGVTMRNMPRVAAEPFMRVVGEMLDLEEAAADHDLVEAAVVQTALPTPQPPSVSSESPSGSAEESVVVQAAQTEPTSTTPEQRRSGGRRGGRQA